MADAKEKQRLEQETLAKAAEEKRLAEEKALADVAEKKRLEEEAKAALLENNYKNALTTGDSAFRMKNFSVAKTAYNTAISLKSSENYPKDRIAEIDELLATVYKNDLAKKYPQGVTEEIEKENNARIIKRIVVNGNKGVLYIKKETGFGQIYYFKDGIPITEQEFNRDTELK